MKILLIDLHFPVMCIENMNTYKMQVHLVGGFEDFSPNVWTESSIKLLLFPEI